MFLFMGVRPSNELQYVWLDLKLGKQESNIRNGRHATLMIVNIIHKTSLLASDYTCGVAILGIEQDAGTEWSDESCAMMHGPVTGVRMWATGNLIKLWVTHRKINTLL